MESRLSRRIENKTKRRLILNIVGTVLILFLLIRYGVPALISFSEFLSNRNTPSTTITNKKTTFLAAPIINPTSYSATNSATISLTGTAISHTTVLLFINNSEVANTDTKDDGTFRFDTVTLTNGQNTIQAKAKNDTTQSDFSDSLSIIYANKAPTLSVDSPSDGQSFSKDQNTVVVKGKTDSDDKVTVNGFWAVIDSSGNYSYTLQLQNGDNQIIVDSTDAAGNKTEKTLKVTYSQ